MQVADFISVVVGTACDLSRIKTGLVRLSRARRRRRTGRGLGRPGPDAATRYVMSVLSPDTVDNRLRSTDPPRFSTSAAH